MAPDNKQSVFIKRLEVDPLIPPKRCRGSGEPTFNDSLAVVDDAHSHPSVMSTFVPKPFPPPSLAGVPLEYILDQLHNLAPRYWHKPETADCTLVIPVPYPRKANLSGGPSSPFSTRPSYDPSGLGRRVTEPALNFIPRLFLRLHTDYLSAHSSFLRALFSGSSPIDLINTSSCSHPTPNSPLRTSSGRFTIPPDRLPRLLPNSTPEHPVLFLPIPDPTSIEHVIHWMYFGDFTLIEDSLEDGSIDWEGIARNVEYLGLPTEIKVFLGRWYARWLHPEQERHNSAVDSDDDDTVFSDDDYDYDTSSDVGKRISTWKQLTTIDDKPTRGRTKCARPLSWTIPFTDSGRCPPPVVIPAPPEISPFDPSPTC
ncbi:hypothetical protein VNI00_009490 [Paramarasmius palmivorus]|uniref:BTB domain-containing protein n=1 Tax=Paramarasmius palmivorus TaxID=297713 RepID=A0AAW0CLX8_9AGAR